MNCTSKTRRSIGLIFVVSVAVAVMIGFSAKVAKADPCILPDFDPVDFDTPLVINNDFFTLEPGTAFCYQSDSEDGERNEVTVTNCDPLEIGGVNTIIVRDAVFVHGDLTEDTFDFYAQDNAGTVRYLGEATKECSDEDPDTEGTWNAYPEGECDPMNPHHADDCPSAGEDDYCSCGGDPGIIMLADPMNGNCYKQEFLPDHAEDIAKVLRLNANVSVPFGDFDNCPKTKEWTPLAPGNTEHKYYSDAADVMNNVLTEELHGGTTVRVELVDVASVEKDGFCPSNFKDALDKLCDEVEAPLPMTTCVFP
jgi:hypothetical protein